MEFKELKHRLFYSEAMRALDTKEAPVGGYSRAGGYARQLQRYVEVETAVLCGVKKDRDGILRPGKSLIELENQSLSRKPGLDEKRKRKVLELFQEIIAGAATDEERVEKIIDP